MSKDFKQLQWDTAMEADCRRIVRLAIEEDLNQGQDLTTAALVPPVIEGSAAIVSRQVGCVAGLKAAETALDEMQFGLAWKSQLKDGDRLEPGTILAEIHGPAAQILAAERILLNLIGRLSGVATLTRRYVEAVAGSTARVYDTRKTTPGWRRLEKYAVRCGGGWNHRTGLFDAILIKDNHLAVSAASTAAPARTIADAVGVAREFLVRQTVAAKDTPQQSATTIVEVEVDTLEQFQEVLPARPDIVLLDNMSPALLKEAVQLKSTTAPDVELEASGGITLETIATVAQTGVDRISVGALTHSAIQCDVGLDWRM